VSVYSHQYEEDKHFPNLAYYEGDGSTSLFAAASGLPYYGIDPSRYLVAVGGILQKPLIDFCTVDIDFGSICFSTPPASGVPISLYTFNFIPSSTVTQTLSDTIIEAPTIPAPIITHHSMSDSATLVLGYNDGFYGNNSCAYLVTVDGLLQRPDVDFIASRNNNGAICFTSHVPNDSCVTVWAYNYINSGSRETPTVEVPILGLTTLTHVVSSSDDFMKIGDGERERYLRVWDSDYSN
jgi:hypothetical protein